MCGCLSTPAIEALHSIISADEAVRHAASAATVEALCKELLHKFFGDHNLPVPHIVIRDHTNTKTLARDIYKLGDKNTTMEVQKSVVPDDTTLRRIITHELIHHWQFLVMEHGEKSIQARRIGIQTDGHGKDFLEYAEKINSVMGKDYVTVVSDQSYKVERKEFFILIQPHPGKGYGYTIAVRPSQAQKDEIHDRVTQRNGRLFKISDPRYLSGAAVKKFGGYSVPLGHDEQTFLDHTYNQGTQVSL